MRYHAVFVVIFTLSFSCAKKNSMTPDYSNLTNLPKDTGGIHTPIYYNSNVNSYGYYVFSGERGTVCWIIL